MTNNEARSILIKTKVMCVSGKVTDWEKAQKLAYVALEENDKLKAEIEQLKSEIKKVIPFEFGQKLYSIETWPDAGSSDIFEYTFDGVEADGIRLIYQGNKGDVCVFTLDEIGVNIFESMDEAEKVLKGGSHDS